MFYFSRDNIFWRFFLNFRDFAFEQLWRVSRKMRFYRENFFSKCNLLLYMNLPTKIVPPYSILTVARVLSLKCFKNFFLTSLDHQRHRYGYWWYRSYGCSLCCVLYLVLMGVVKWGEAKVQIQLKTRLNIAELKK